MKKRARINWLTPEQGGRAALPADQRYVTIAKFAEDGPSWPDGAWSVVTEFDVEPIKQGNPSLGTVSFLMENAPRERLAAGTKFELHEGRKLVAFVDVLS
jgi:hypothetical protein